MKPLDKKQLPQVIVLGILAVAFFGYFAVKMIVPTPAAAGVRVAQSTALAAKTAAAVPAAADATAGLLNAPAPTPGMHDPFVPEVSSAPALPPAAPKPAPVVRTASLKGADSAPLQIPDVAPLPSVGIHETTGAFPNVAPTSLPPAPVAPVAPEWTVTGVLQSGSEHVAVLRSGDARRFVKEGDLLDSEFRVAAVTRDAVILRHGAARFLLPLGGAKAAAPAKPVGPAPYVPALPKPAVSVPSLDISALPLPVSAGRIARLTRRHSTCPVIRLADYRRDETSELMPDPSRGLLAIGALAPDFSLSTLDGRSFALSQFRGSPVVLNFWSSWDESSVRSLAPMDQLQHDYAGKGVTVVAVNTWDSRDTMQAVLEGREWNGPMLYDPSVSSDAVAVRFYRSPDVPTIYVIDQQGRIAGAFVGFGRSTTGDIKATLAKLGVA